MKTISIYVRNKEFTPSSYYRIIQYARNFNGEVTIREIAPNWIYKLKRDSSNKNTIQKFVVGVIYFLTMLTRASLFLIIDTLKSPNYVIVSKTFLPRYNPIYILTLIKILCKKAKLYWDFDDNIFISGEISKKQKEILERYSSNIIVTNEFLKSKISIDFQRKILLMPTTDGDLQGFNQEKLVYSRLQTYSSEIRLVWVATSGNLKHLSRVITSLDKAALKLKEKFDKRLILKVVCNKPLVVKTNDLIIENILWNRDIARDSIYNSHIGIMPLMNNEYTQGKGGFKLIQYISTGLPVIASNLSFNAEIVSSNCGILVDDSKNTEEWVDAIVDLGSNEERWNENSNNAYSRWLNKFSYSVNQETWNSLINQ